MIEVKKLLSLDTCFDQETSFYSIVPLLCMFPFEFKKKKKQVGKEVWSQLWEGLLGKSGILYMFNKKDS